MNRILYPVAEAAEQLGIGLTTAKALIASRQLRSIKIGHSRRVPADALREFAHRLDIEQNGDGAVGHRPDAVA